jgi:hypothetical protein
MIQKRVQLTITVLNISSDEGSLTPTRESLRIDLFTMMRDVERVEIHYLDRRTRDRIHTHFDAAMRQQ